MFHSCSQRPALGGKTLSPAPPFIASRPHQHLLKPGRGPSLGSCFGFSPLSSASQHQLQQSSLVVASLKPPSGKGFGKKNVVEKSTSPESSEVTSSSKSPPLEDAPAKFQYRKEEVDDDDDDEEGVVPEVVTNRMLTRIGITVGVPLGLGLLLFPLFYYLKIVSKVDVPEWLPLVVSMVTFGTAGLGITYGVVSTSWDPARAGSLLGWKEAQVNWPLLWNKVQSNQKKK